MDRRAFLKSSSAVLAAVALEPKQISGIQTNASMPAAGRLVLSMNRNWRFSTDRVKNDTARNFDDSHFELVTIPHTNKKLPWHSFDEKSYQFVSVYRRRFNLPREARGHRVFVDFEGAMTASTVWINGQRLGEYKGGYTPFSFELTPYVDWDRENVLAVELDSTERADIPPFGGSIDYLTFGGIYRDVSLRIVPVAFLENIFARAEGMLTDNPRVRVTCVFAHLDALPTSLILEVELRDGDRILSSARTDFQFLDAVQEPVPPDRGAQLREIDLRNLGPIQRWDLSSSQDLRIEGYLAGKKVIEKKYSSKGVDQQFLVQPDDTTLMADGADATRVVLRVNDEFGNLLRYSTAAVALAIDGPAEIIGDNPFSLMGGCGAIWVRAGQKPGFARLKATHSALGRRDVEIRIVASEPERV